MAISQYPAGSSSSGSSVAKKYLQKFQSLNSASASVGTSNVVVKKIVESSNNSTAQLPNLIGHSLPSASDFADKNFFAGGPSSYKPIGDFSGEVYLDSYTSEIIQYPTASFIPFSSHNGSSIAGSDLNTNYKFVSVGNSGRLYSSSDGIIWTDRGYIPALDYSNLFFVKYSAGIFVAAGESGKVAYSIDGASWTLASTGITATIQNGYYEDSKFWLLGGNKIASSADGVTWTTSTLPFTIGSYASIDFAYGNGIYFISNSSNSKLYKSTDGSTWNEVTSGPFYPGSFNNRVHAIAYGNNKFVALSPNANLSYVSTDGNNWSTYNIPFFSFVSPSSMSGLQFLNNKFIVLGLSVICQSEDGVTWRYFGKNYQPPFKEIFQVGNEYYQNSSNIVYKTTELSKIAENFAVLLYEPSEF
jgi:hypothetical protein